MRPTALSSPSEFRQRAARRRRQIAPVEPAQTWAAEGSGLPDDATLEALSHDVLPMPMTGRLCPVPMDAKPAEAKS